MAVIEPVEARTFAAAWIEAWNAHDIERVLSHYAEGVEFHSPFVARVAGESSGGLKGKGALREYWTKALAMLPSLHFELIDVFAGADCLTIHYQGHRGKAAETFVFDATGKVVFATACYS